MSEEEKKPPTPVVVLELKVYMHCKACEKSVFKTLRRYNGVENVKTDMEGHRATVTGKIDAAKMLKKLRKKTGKRAEIVEKVEDEIEKTAEEMNSIADGSIRHDVDHDDDLVAGNLIENHGVSFDMFSDENPNACSVM